MVYIVFGKDAFRAKRFTESLENAFRTKHPAAVFGVFEGADEVAAAFFFVSGANLFSEPKFALLSIKEEAKKEFAKYKTPLDALADRRDRMLLVRASAKSDLSASLLYSKKIPQKEFAPLKGKAFTNWISESAEELGIKLEPHVAEWLSRLADSDTWFAHTELEKLANFKPGGTVTLQDASKLSSQAPQPQFFPFIEALLGKDRKAALGLFFEELENGGDPIGIFASITNALRNVMLLRAASRLGIRERPSVLHGINAFWLSKLKEHSQRLSDGEIKRGFQGLALLDWQIKSGRQDAVSAIEHFIVSW